VWGTGGGAGAAGLGSVVRISSAGDAPDNDSELVGVVCSCCGGFVGVCGALVAVGAARDWAVSCISAVRKMHPTMTANWWV
jgi:hypothetical protein